jgi:peroxiredoxin Q/BCP
MMINIGDTAPDFELESDDGELVTLDGLLEDGPLILYFYPADFTPVCTAEACSIRDMHDDIASVNMQVVGVSPQSTSSHERFKRTHSLPFPLLYDRGKKVIRAYGVDGPFGMGVRRATFHIGDDGIVKGRVVSDLFVGNHTDFIKQAITQ